MRLASLVAGSKEVVYFENVVLRECKLALSVDTCRALTREEQASEGDYSRVHAAVVKGDVDLVGGFAVHVDSHNTTARRAVGGALRGIFFDALLRVDAANIVLDPVLVRHHLSSGVSGLVSTLIPAYIVSASKSLPSVLGAMRR